MGLENIATYIILEEGLSSDVSCEEGVGGVQNIKNQSKSKNELYKRQQSEKSWWGPSMVFCF